MKRLYRSATDKQIAGVCGGLAEYFDIDATLVRVGFIFITFVTGFVPGILAYIVMAIITPFKSEVIKNGKKDSKA
ncbi:MAG: PspC domain-containing protein [Candidatus Saccharibacteria bacterium]